MPSHCATYNCTLCRKIETSKPGMTFHRFPRDYGLRRKWEVALRREGFAANDEWVLCSDHFKPVSLTGLGRFVGLDLVSSVFNFTAHLGRVLQHVGKKNPIDYSVVQKVQNDRMLPKIVMYDVVQKCHSAVYCQNSMLFKKTSEYNMSSKKYYRIILHCTSKSIVIFKTVQILICC
uniref:THAP-type domain-containing protein n=1 Tax=Amphiprion ocellaris TaxID=80972 RepID=A0AAQ5YNW3_AMPOC